MENTLSETHSNKLAVNFTGLYVGSVAVERPITSYEIHK